MERSRSGGEGTSCRGILLLVITTSGWIAFISFRDQLKSTYLDEAYGIWHMAYGFVVKFPTSVQPPAASYHIIVGQLWIYLAVNCARIQHCRNTF